MGAEHAAIGALLVLTHYGFRIAAIRASISSLQVTVAHDRPSISSTPKSNARRGPSVFDGED